MWGRIPILVSQKFSSIFQKYHISEKKNIEATDESLMMESLDYKVCVVRGDYNNFKITSREDWERAENIVA